MEAAPVDDSCWLRQAYAVPIFDGVISGKRVAEYPNDPTQIFLVRLCSNNNGPLFSHAYCIYVEVQQPRHG